MDGFHYTITIYGIIGILFFITQLFLCHKTKRNVIKLIPAYIILFFTMLAVFFALGVFGRGFLNAEQIVAFLIFIGVVSAFTGSLTGWVAYRIYKIKRTN